MNIFIQGSQGNKIFNATYAMAAQATSDVKYPTLAASANYWSASNPEFRNGLDPASTTGRSYIESTVSAGRQLSALQKISAFPIRFHARPLDLPISDSLSVQNSITFTKYKGYDPEADSMGNNDASAGVDNGAYPNPHGFTIDRTLNFNYQNKCYMKKYLIILAGCLLATSCGKDLLVEQPKAQCRRFL
jgi:hypothetical protein